MPAIELTFAAILLAAAVSDARRFLIPNFYPLCLMLLAALAWIAGFPFSGPIWSHLLHFAAALTVGMLMFHFGWFGGGDVKLYAALALWFDFSEGLTLLLVTSLAGVVVVLLSTAMVMVRTIFGASKAQRSKLRDRRIAYGVAIAAGGILNFYMLYR